MSNSERDLWLSLPEPDRDSLIQSLPPDELYVALYDWRGLWARANQVAPPGEWQDWLLLAGRGFGKTRTAAEWCAEQIREMPGSRGTIVAPTYAIGRDVCIEGESGLLACLPPYLEPAWNRSLGELRLKDGTLVRIYSADAPDSLRGQQAHWMWAEELAAWKKSWDAWDQAKFGLRLRWGAGAREGRCVVSTTPRPVNILRKLVKRATTVVTRGTTYENLHNLSAAYRELIETYKGTRIGRQELEGELLEDVPGALWTRALLERLRVDMPPVKIERRDDGSTVDALDLERIVVAIDPATTAEEESDETGIVVVGKGSNGKLYVLEDRSGQYKPAEWADAAIDAFEFWKADRIVAEANQGGDLVERNIRAAGVKPGHPRPPVRLVHATRSKQTRAEPVATLYEREKVHHVGPFPLLEDQLCTWVPGMKSPDRLDALVWGVVELDRPRYNAV